MVFSPDAVFQHDDWDYIVGNMPRDGKSISVERFMYLRELNWYSKDTLKLSARNPENNAWTKWNLWYDTKTNLIQMAYDLHRSILDNEIVIESDYPTFEENSEAAKIVGAILEDKGFQPVYYYSGSKSIHMHIWLDFQCLLQIDMSLQMLIIDLFANFKKFKKAFMDFLREKMITCWGLKVRQFDEQIKADSHLIRSEMSCNKLGYKCLIGYTHKDISWIPPLCNVENGFYPVIGELKESYIDKENISEIVEEFLAKYRRKEAKKQVERKSATLLRWTNPDFKKSVGIRPSVDFIMSDDFKAVGDGLSRGMFILINELKDNYGLDIALQQALSWNIKMGSPFQDTEIKYRVERHKVYPLSNKYIDDFLDSLGLAKRDKKV